jgi:hypothetical protein
VTPILAILLATTFAVAAPPLPERDAIAIVPDGMPAAIDHALYFEDGAMFTVLLRNRSGAVVRIRLRVLAFDERRRLRGAHAYCLPDPMEPGIGQRVNFPLEIKGTVARDRYAVVVEEMIGERAQWRVPSGLAGAIDAARSAVELRGWRLAAERVAGTGRIEDCDCSCERIAAEGDRICGSGDLAAFTCTPALLGGCRESVTCK